METKNVICLMPVYNDWESLSIMVQKIGAIFSAQNNYSATIVAINDGSTESAIEDFAGVDIVNLKANVGHQRAIAIGLQYISAEKTGYDFVVVLDSDGEDKPDDIMSMIAKCEADQNKKIIFAQRKKRTESVLFKAGYFFYKNCFYAMTGQKISFGNFSCIPARLLKRIALLDHLWNHYSGAIIQSKMPYDRLLLDRGTRYAGQSKMNFTSLVLHGLSSIAVYFDFLSVRILKFSLYGIALCFMSVLVVLYLKLFTVQSIPGWASNLILIIFSIILQLSSVTLIVLLMQLSARKNIKSPSATIYTDFIESVEKKSD